jgi:hypothetical protein
LPQDRDGDVNQLPRNGIECALAVLHEAKEEFEETMAVCLNQR